MVGPVECAATELVIVFIVVDGTASATYIVCQIHTRIVYFKTIFKKLHDSRPLGSRLASSDLNLKYFRRVFVSQ